MSQGIAPARVEVKSQPGADWNDCVARCSGASAYHRAEWIQLIRKVFQQQAYFLEARDAAGRLVGVLPLVRQRGPLLGSFMTSIPYFNYGGAVAENEEVVLQLMEAGRALARRYRCRYLELRDVTRHAGQWQVRTDKVSMVLDLPANADALGSALGAKLRSQIRRPDRENAQVAVGGSNQIDAFYEVFCRNMHALGTPVYPRRFFRMLIEALPEYCTLCVVYRDAVPQAAGFLVIDGDTAEIPWAACRDDAKGRGYNMKLYWECISLAIARGCTRFDFGRSTMDSGTFRFKAQWGAKPSQLYWHRWEAGNGAEADSSGDGWLRNHVTRLWSALPLSVANTIGPLISPRLPW
jgi:serine/alanine adding enzyme